MTEINKLLDRYQQFYDEYFVHSPELYRKLSAEGQAPKTLVIACSDSRVDPSIIFKSEPGELFVIRNVASLVPPFECDFVHCHGTSAAIEYAVRHLGVENIVVLGHSHCGGIKTLVDGDCEKKAVAISVRNLQTFPFVAEKVAAGKLRLCGWYFCIESGRLEEVCRAE